MGSKLSRSVGLFFCLACSVAALAGATERTTASFSVRWEGNLPRSIAAPPDGSLSPAHAGSPESAARAFLRDQRELFRLTDRDLAGLELTSSVRGPAGSTHLYFQQTIGGIDVHGGRINITVRADGAVLFVGSRLFPGQADPGAPVLDGHAAERRAAETLGGTSSREPTSRLVVVPHDGVGRLAWEVRLTPKDDRHGRNGARSHEPGVPRQRARAQCDEAEPRG